MFDMKREADPTADQKSAENRAKVQEQVASAAHDLAAKGVTDFDKVYRAMLTGGLMAEMIKPGSSLVAMAAAMAELVMRELESALPEV